MKAEIIPIEPDTVNAGEGNFLASETFGSLSFPFLLFIYPHTGKDFMFDLQFITHHTARYSYLDGVTMALQGGCKWIQLRMKEASLPEMAETALQVKQLCSRYGAVFILDDEVDLALETGADGVHLGLQDMPVSEARKRAHPGFIIGATANTFDTVKQHYADGADYIGCGPLRFTSTKKNLSPLLGLSGYETIIGQMRAQGIELPLIAIGGITEADIPDLKRLGVNGVALSGYVLQADDPIERMKGLMQLVTS